MEVYRLYTICPYYGDVSEVGIFSSPEKADKAKAIICRNIQIKDYSNRFEVDQVTLDEMPYEYDKGK